MGDDRAASDRTRQQPPAPPHGRTTRDENGAV